MKESFDVIPSAAGLFLREPLTSKAFLRVESSFNKKRLQQSEGVF